MRVSPVSFIRKSLLIGTSATVCLQAHYTTAGCKIDGLGYWGVFWRIVVPNSYGIIAALSVITFIASWNAFLWPLIVGQDASAWTIQVVLSNFLNAQVLNLHELFIGAAIGILSLVIIFFILQHYIVEGYKQSGLKG
jgi:multiple sugar transport system permease protein